MIYMALCLLASFFTELPEPPAQATLVSGSKVVIVGECLGSARIDDFTTETLVQHWIVRFRVNQHIKGHLKGVKEMWSNGQENKNIFVVLSIDLLKESQIPAYRKGERYLLYLDEEHVGGTFFRSSVDTPWGEHLASPESVQQVLKLSKKEPKN